MPRYCTHCILPDTRPGVVLDANGICGGCRNNFAKDAVDWKARAEAFRAIAAGARRKGRRWDCIIPVSGGKDSFWLVVTCLEHGLHPLCVTYAAPLRNALGDRNLRRLIALGVDHFEFRPNPHVERTFIGKAFRSRGITGLVTHMGIFSVPLQLAVAFDVPLVIYAENSAIEYGSDDDRLAGARLDHAWLARFGVTDGTTAEDWIDDELDRAALAPFFVPPARVMEEQGIEAIFLGYYHRWDPEHSRRVAGAHGFEARAEGPLVGHYDYVNIDDELFGVHHHAKWHKFGITRSWDTLSMEIRNGRLSREEAIAHLRALGDETPWESIRLFCDYLGIPRDEYFDTLERHRNRELWTRRDGRWVIDGFLLPEFPWPSDEEIRTERSLAAAAQ